MKYPFPEMYVSKISSKVMVDSCHATEFVSSLSLESVTEAPQLCVKVSSVRVCWVTKHYSASTSFTTCHFVSYIISRSLFSFPQQETLHFFPVTLPPPSGKNTYQALSTPPSTVTNRLLACHCSTTHLTLIPIVPTPKPSYEHSPNRHKTPDLPPHPPSPILPFPHSFMSSSYIKNASIVLVFIPLHFPTPFTKPISFS